jgi:hypothetical protein
MKAQLNAQAREDKARKDAEKKAWEDAEMKGVELEEDPAKIRKLKGKKLGLQISWHGRNPNINPNTGKFAVVGISSLRHMHDKKERSVELAPWAKLPSHTNNARMSGYCPLEVSRGHIVGFDWTHKCVPDWQSNWIIYGTDQSGSEDDWYDLEDDSDDLY